MSNSINSTRRLVGLAIFTAIVMVLQVVATFVKPGAFPLNLTLIPIVVGAAIYGPGAGAFLGGVFGFVVVFATVTGGDASAYIMFSARPFVTILLIMVKGILAGYCAGLVYRLFEANRPYWGVVVSAVVAPVVNTGIFCLSMALFYRELLIQWAGGTSLVYFAIFGLTGVNFLMELGINMVLSPVIVRIIHIGKKELKA